MPARAVCYSKKQTERSVTLRRTCHVFCAIQTDSLFVHPSRTEFCMTQPFVYMPSSCLSPNTQIGLNVTGETLMEVPSICTYKHHQFLQGSVWCCLGQLSRWPRSSGWKTLHFSFKCCILTVWHPEPDAKLSDMRICAPGSMYVVDLNTQAFFIFNYFFLWAKMRKDSRVNRYVYISPR